MHQPIIYCSHKFSKLLGLSQKSSEFVESSEAGDNWNGLLFYLEKRKCLIFMNKQTLYSFLLIDVLKKDLDKFNKLFVDNLIEQLYFDNLLTSIVERNVRTKYQSIFLRKTDNDKKVIGSMNDHIFTINVYAETEGGLHKLHNRFMGQQLNRTPMGAVKGKFPVNLMREKIEYDS